MAPVSVRPEFPSDVGTVRRIHEVAFGQPGEAGLVDALRFAGAVTLSLVAEVEGRVVGHVLFSRVDVERDGAQAAAVGLAPLAVLPGHQRGGVGSALVREGLARLARAGHGGVILLGHPGYYLRFGFQSASRFGLRWEVRGHEESFMALKLVPGALGTRPGVVRYRPEFRAL